MRISPRIPFLAALVASASFATAALSEEDFRTPPLQARPAVLWTWLNGFVDEKQITRELEEMKAKGLRGAIIWDLGSIADPQKIIPAGPAFLGPESLKSIHHAMDEAARLGLELGMVAASSWNSGGPWITPDDGSKKLLWSELAVEGPSEFSGVLPLPAKVGSVFQETAVIAVPVAGSGKPIVIDAKPDSEGRLAWSVPAGSWKILRFICSNTDEGLICPSPNSQGPLIDHLSGKATAAHLDHILDTLSKGRDGFGALTHLMHDSYEVRPATDWTPDFLESFQAAYGYDARPWLPVLAGLTVGNAEQGKRFKHDYTKMVSDLMVKDHYALSREILNKRGLKLLAEGGHGGHARVDPLKALGAADIPMGEFWNHRKNWVTKEAASAAHIYGRTLVNSESLTGWQNWQDGPATYKRLTDIAFCAGLNQVTFHTFAHNPPSAGLPGFAYHAGEHFNVNSTWWNQARPMLADMSRSSHLLQQGKFVADVAVYYGDEAPNLVPARRIAPTIKSDWADDKCAHCGRDLPVDLSSLGHGYDHDYVNEEVILERMQVQDGKLMLPDGMSYRLLVLPDREAISPAVLRKIAELVQAGATVVGRKPERSNSLKGFPGCDDEVRQLAAEIWGDCDGETIRTHAFGKGRVMWNRPLDEVLLEMGVAPDFTVESMENKDRMIDFIHRATGEEDIYFVSNSSMQRQEFPARFRVGSGRLPSLWNPEDGTVEPCHVFEKGDGFVRVPLVLPPASSVFVVFRKEGRDDHLVQIGKGLQVLSKEGDKLKVRVAVAGAHRLATAAGKSANFELKDVPEAVEIAGEWKVEFPAGRGAPATVTMDKLADWTKSSDPGVRYFSGTATYRKSFEVSDPPETLFLDLGTVGEVATVKVNGNDAGILWKLPYSVNIAPLVHSGTNQLEISVTNLWNNRIVGDLQSDKDEDFTRTNLKSKFSAKSPLLPSGLIGPVTLRTPVDVTVELK
jgi:alpha-L-rhamnosidase